MESLIFAARPPTLLLKYAGNQIDYRRHVTVFATDLFERIRPHMALPPRQVPGHVGLGDRPEHPAVPAAPGLVFVSSVAVMHGVRVRGALILAHRRQITVLAAGLGVEITELVSVEFLLVTPVAPRLVYLGGRNRVGPVAVGAVPGPGHQCS